MNLRVLGVCLLFVGLLSISPMTGAESRTYHYDAPGWHVTWDICADVETVAGSGVRDTVCGLNGDHINVGGVQNMETPDSFSFVLIAANDDLFGSGVNIYGGWSDEAGGFARDFFGDTCGPILDWGRKGDYLHVWVQAFHQTPDLELCFGSMGTITADYA